MTWSRIFGATDIEKTNMEKTTMEKTNVRGYKYYQLRNASFRSFVTGDKYYQMTWSHIWEATNIEKTKYRKDKYRKDKYRSNKYRKDKYERMQICQDTYHQIRNAYFRSTIAGDR